jgi:NAD(P)H-flavin reductase/ferredoxin
MGKKCKVVVNDEEFFAERGELLLDAALMNGIDIPHDCRSGHCGTCRVNVVSGRVYAGPNSEEGVVHACQCRIITDAEFMIEDVPEIATTPGRVTRLVPLASDVVEVWIEPSEPVEYLPGQYLQVQFRKFPARCYSPTVPLTRSSNDTIRLHVRRVPNGRVSSALGREIREGHRLKLTGPFGSAYLRPDLTNRLVLVASGTGFAPIWSIADAALRENPRRDVVVVVGARTIESLYMIPALCRLARCRNVAIVPVVDTPQEVTNVVRTGRPTDHLPTLCPDDIVYACGAPPMVEAVKAMAAEAGAVCYADPFVPKGDEEGGLLSQALTWIKGEPRAAEPETKPAAPRHAPKAAPRARTMDGWQPADVRPNASRHPDSVRRAAQPRAHRPRDVLRLAAYDQAQHANSGRFRPGRFEVE